MLVCFISVLLVFTPHPVEANPVFARQYDVSCSLCHAAYPRLNRFGEDFVKNNFRMPNWREQVTIDTGDEMLALPKRPPLAFRVQAYSKIRSEDVVDEKGAATLNGQYDIQAPYLIKLLSSAPLSDHMTYYFYAMIAEKGANGEILVEDAWLSYANLLGSGVDFTAGQFQLSDLMFPRETRLTFQDFIAYRMAGITYDRGIQMARDLGPVNLTLGISNGNGIEDNAKLNSAGFGRPDRAFDNNRSKTVYGHLGSSLGDINLGLFASNGKRSSAIDNKILIDGRVLGADVSYNLNDQWFLFGQYLHVTLSDALTAGQNDSWYGGFLGLDYIHNERWVFSFLYNYANANDFSSSNTIYEGIDLNSLTGTTSYYLMRNVKAILEVNYDLLPTDPRNGFGHDTKEHYLLAGIDMAF
ncbi:MAG TPA: hypothetical protein ENK06_09170 [Gammaproteobacteria bacterium]|nr:hypothetical protein [Gammaproteobacteria bacterium]